MAKSKLQADGPRLFVGEFEVVPKLDSQAKVVPHQWAWPGRTVMNTMEVSRLAKNLGLRFSMKQE